MCGWVGGRHIALCYGCDQKGPDSFRCTVGESVVELKLRRPGELVGNFAMAKLILPLEMDICALLLRRALLLRLPLGTMTRWGWTDMHSLFLDRWFRSEANDVCLARQRCVCARACCVVVNHHGTAMLSKHTSRLHMMEICACQA